MARSAVIQPVQLFYSGGYVVFKGIVVSNEFFSLEQQNSESSVGGVGLGCITGLISGGVSCLAYGCLGLVLLPIVVLWVLWRYFSPWIVFFIATAPTIYLIWRWVRFHELDSFETLEQIFSRLLQVRPTTNKRFAIFCNFSLWALLQIPYYLMLIYLFPALR